VIAKLRRRHARMIPALAIAAPLVLLVSLATRTPPAAAPAFPAPLAQTVSHAIPARALSIFDSALLWPGLALQTRVLVSGDQHYLELVPHRPLRAPDVLLYRSARPATGDALPDDVQLLGRFTGSHRQAFALDAGIPTSLWLYSLAHAEVVGRADLGEARR
jgi:hypothetical protein